MPETKSVQQVLDNKGMRDILTTTIQEIAKSPLINLDKLCFVGIRRRGVPLSEQFRQRLSELTKREFPIGALDITLYRDDLSQIAPNPVVNITDIPFDVTGKIILLVDDVLYTGRTIRAALDAIIDLGRPEAIRLLVLVDRGHREFPIQADFCGIKVETKKDQIVEVRVKPIDEEERVDLLSFQ